MQAAVPPLRDPALKKRAQEKMGWSLQLPPQGKRDDRIGKGEDGEASSPLLRLSVDAEGGAGVDLEADAFAALKVGDDGEQASGGGIAVGAKHLVQGFHVNSGSGSELRKAHGGVDVVAKEFLAESDFAGEKVFESFSEQAFSESGIALGAGLDGLFEGAS